MKNRMISLLITVLVWSGSDLTAQPINWKALSSAPNWSLGGFAGVEHGLIAGAQVNRKIRFAVPLVLTATVSLPAGDKPLEDFKINTGAQFRIFEIGSLQFSGKAEGLFRRYQSDFARLLNFGCEISGTIGYYRSKWFAGAVLGFDKAIVTHFRHTDLYKSNFPGVVDGWYEPATGGQFYYGVQAGRSWGRLSLYADVGKSVEQDFSTRPLVPYYGKIGLMVGIGKK